MSYICVLSKTMLASTTRIRVLEVYKYDKHRKRRYVQFGQRKGFNQLLLAGRMVRIIEVWTRDDMYTKPFGSDRNDKVASRTLRFHLDIIVAHWSLATFPVNRNIPPVPGWYDYYLTSLSKFMNYVTVRMKRSKVSWRAGYFTVPSAWSMFQIS